MLRIEFRARRVGESVAQYLIAYQRSVELWLVGFRSGKAWGVGRV